MQEYRSERVQGCTVRKLEKPEVIEELQNTKEKETKGEIRSEGVRITYKLRHKETLRELLDHKKNEVGNMESVNHEVRAAC